MRLVLHGGCNGKPLSSRLLRNHLIRLIALPLKEVTLLSFLSICAGADWGLSKSQVASISSAVFVGVLFGNLFWGPVAGGSFDIHVSTFVKVLLPGFVTLSR
jgi:hypothetical protein